jgi:hypothetical protein
MRLSILFLAIAIAFGTPQQEKQQESKMPAQREEKKDEKKKDFDPFADPTEELIKRAERTAKEKRYNELKEAAAQLKELSIKMSDEIEAGGKDVFPAKLMPNLDRAEKLVRTMREKAK